MNIIKENFEFDTLNIINYGFYIIILAGCLYSFQLNLDLIKTKNIKLYFLFVLLLIIGSLNFYFLNNENNMTYNFILNVMFVIFFCFVLLSIKIVGRLSECTTLSFKHIILHSVCLFYVITSCVINFMREIVDYINCYSYFLFLFCFFLYILGFSSIYVDSFELLFSLIKDKFLAITFIMTCVMFIKYQYKEKYYVLDYMLFYIVFSCFLFAFFNYMIFEIFRSNLLKITEDRDNVCKQQQENKLIDFYEKYGDVWVYKNYTTGLMVFGDKDKITFYNHHVKLIQYYFGIICFYSCFLSLLYFLFNYIFDQNALFDIMY